MYCERPPITLRNLRDFVGSPKMGTTYLADLNGEEVEFDPFVSGAVPIEDYESLLGKGVRLWASIEMKRASCGAFIHFDVLEVLDES
jgi:hypothetical protein